jgi:hypothetical protein
MNEFRSGERDVLAAMYTTNKAPTTITPTVTAFMVSSSLTVVSTRPIRRKATRFGINEVLKLLAVYSRFSAGQVVDRVGPFGRR